MATDTAKVEGRSDAVVLEELLRRYSYATDEWADIRDEGSQDMKAVSGNPWSDKDRKDRADAGRPCLSLDELGQYVNQVINDILQNKRAIKVTPIGNGANDKTAEARSNLMRQIEYESNAQTAYTTAFENSLQRSYGFWRVKAKYESDRSFNQKLVIDAIMNPDMVTPDPDALSPTGKDMQYLFNEDSYAKADFTAKFPKAQIQSFGPEQRLTAPQWIGEDRIKVAEYWVIEKKPSRLLLIAVEGKEPQGFIEADLPNGAIVDDKAGTVTMNGAVAQIVKTRAIEVPKVMSYLTNGVEILQRTAWPGKYIPFVCCYGKILYMDKGEGAKRTLLSMVRLAREPYMFYCYIRTCEAEMVGMTPKFPYFVFEGQLAPEELLNLQKSLHEPIAVIRVKPNIEGMAPDVNLGFPQRQPYQPELMGLEALAEAARRSIQAAMGGAPLPTQAQRHNEKSGVALKQIADSSQRGSFHFIDHYEQSITRGGEIMDDLIPHYYDAARDLTMRSPDGEASVQRVNDPQAVDPKTSEPAPVMLTDGDHDVTLSTGPSMDSEREAASDYADLLANIPGVFPVLGPLITKLKNLGPIGDEIAELLEAMQPPEVKAIKDGPPQIPPQIQQQLQGLQQENQALKQAIATEQAKEQAETQRAIDANQTKIEIARIQAQSKLVGDELKAASEDAERRIQILETMIHVQKEERLHGKDQAHEVGMAAMSHATSQAAAEAARAAEPPAEAGGA